MLATPNETLAYRLILLLLGMAVVIIGLSLVYYRVIDHPSGCDHVGSYAPGRLQACIMDRN